MVGVTRLITEPLASTSSCHTPLIVDNSLVGEFTLITQSELKYRLDYNHNTGVFIWINPSKCHSELKGGIAGCARNSRGINYRHIKVNKIVYASHRLAWLYIYGEFPSGEIDHIDGDGENNRIINLRDVSHSINSKNRKRRVDNNSGHVGVSLNKESNKWRAYISVDGKPKHIGNFEFKNDAVMARLEAEKIHGYHENHGRD